VHRLTFNHAYRERVTLEDGTRAIVRLLRADDKDLLRRGFEQLSDDSRYNRFFVHKASLLEGELTYLTELDQVDHFALVAVGEDSSAGDAPLAVARAVRLLLEHEVYEGAVTVVDAYQRRGLGSQLVRRLVDATTERGGRALRFCVLPTNRPMQALLDREVANPAFVDENGVLRLDIPLGCAGQKRGRSAGS
jgi:ribosomal protein S18 acetylase RimI-like enzyme